LFGAEISLLLLFLSGVGDEEFGDNVMRRQKYSDSEKSNQEVGLTSPRF